MEAHMHCINEASCPEERKGPKTALMGKSHFQTSILVYLLSLLLLSQPSLTSLFSGVGSGAAESSLPSALR